MGPFFVVWVGEWVGWVGGWVGEFDELVSYFHRDAVRPFFVVCVGGWVGGGEEKEAV